MAYSKGPLRVLLLVFALAFLFQQSSGFPLEPEYEEPASSELYRRAVAAPAKGAPAVVAPTGVRGQTTAASSSPAQPGGKDEAVDPINPKAQYCKAKKPTKAGPAPKKAPPVPASKAAPAKGKPAPAAQAKPSPPGPKGVKQREVLEVLDEFNDTASDASTYQLQRRIPFPQGLPNIQNTDAANYARMVQIINDPATQPIIGDPSYANSFILNPAVDIQMGTRGVGLQGCAIVVSHSANRIYVAHAWEVPGFSPLPPDFTRSTFPTEVYGFLAGTPGAVGVGYPLVGTMPAGSTTHLLAVANDRSNTGFTNRPHYPGKVRDLLALFTNNVGPAASFLYRRPIQANGDPVVGVTIEYSAATRHLRVMVSDRRSGADGGYRMIDQAI